MGWAVEQNTGVNDHVIRCIWFKGYIYAFTQNVGVWRRDGIGPWVQVFVGIFGGGIGWHWEDDDALYCGDLSRIYRSTDGVIWNVDVDLNVAFGLQGFYHTWSEIGGYGTYLYVANHDVGIATTYFYRRNLAGVWTVFGAPHAGAEGANGRSIIGFGGEVYWTNNARARYWDGAAWSTETTLDGQGGEYVSLIDDKLYVTCPTTGSYGGGYYWKTTSATNWAWMDLPVPNNTWAAWTLCKGADGESYTLTYSWPHIRIYWQVGRTLELLGYENAPALNMVGSGGICVDDTGAMYWGAREGGTMKFFAFVGNYNATPAGGGLLPQAMDVDGNGDILYLALYDSGSNPVLITVPLLLTQAAVGILQYSPGAGDAINVKTHYNTGNFSIIAGYFGNNEQVRRSIGGGLTYSDIDPGTWAANRAQPIHIDPNDNTRVRVALDGIDDLMEKDSSDAWSTLNTALPFDVGAMAALDINPDEIVIGRKDAGAILVEYTPDNGATLTNITGSLPVGGGVAAVEVV